MLTLYIADAGRGVGMKNLSRKEAITLLRNLEDSLDSYCELNEEGKTAFRMAIEALSCSETPNNSDNISRQQSIDALRKMQTYKLGAGDDLLLIDQAEAQTELMMLPPAQPEQRWTLCSKRMPEEREWIGTKMFGTTISDEVYVTFEAPDGQRFTKHISFQNGKLSPADEKMMQVWFKGAKPIAWKQQPEPYQGGKR